MDAETGELINRYNPSATCGVDPDMDHCGIGVNGDTKSLVGLTTSAVVDEVSGYIMRDADNMFETYERVRDTVYYWDVEALPAPPRD
jgi:hypothetical protein